MSAKKVGRPVSRPKGLQVFTARMTPKAKARLTALSQVKGEHGYVLLEQAFWEHWNNLPPEEQKAAETIAATVERAQRKAKKPGAA